MAAACGIGLFAFRSEFISQADETPAFVPIIGATKSVAVAVGNADADADPGETLEYTIVINNTGPDPATGVGFSDTIQNITTFVGGSTIASPIAVNDSFTSIGNVGISVPDGANDLLANDLDANNPGVNTALVIVAPVPTTTTGGGNLAINTTTGAFTYNPAPGFEGADSFTYTLGNGTGFTNTATVSINVSGMIWFVQNGAAACTTLAGGCGRLSNPFSTLAAFQALNNGTGNNPADNDNIFLYENATAYSGGITMRVGQKLIGQDGTAPLIGAGSVTGITTIPPHTPSGANPTMNGGNTTFTNLSGTTTLNTNAVVRGLRINSTTLTGLNDPAGAITGVSVSEIATITTTTGTAVSLSSNGGAYSIRNISSGAAANGISLSTTTGSFAVTGSGSVVQGGDNSGGTIQNTTGDGISLTNASNLSFNNMNLQLTAGHGINGTQVSNFSFTNGKINGAGDASDESCVSLDDLNANNVSGTFTFNNNQCTQTEANGVDIQTWGSTLSDVNISNNLFTDTGDVATPGSAVLLIGNSTASAAGVITRATLANNQINDFRAGAGFVIQANEGPAANPNYTLGVAGHATNKVSVTGNLMNGGNGGIGNQPDRFITSGINGAGQGNVEVSNNGTAANRIRNIDCIAIELQADGPATMTTVVQNNFINPNSAVGCAGIAVGTDDPQNAGAGTHSTVISGNNVMGTDGPGIFPIVRASGSTMTARVINNTVAAPITTNSARAGIRVDSGSAVGDTTMCLEITGNTTAGSTNTATATTSPGINLRKQGTDPAINSFAIEGMAATASPGVENYVNGLNTSTSGTFGVGGTALLSASSGFTNCNAPLAKMESLKLDSRNTYAGLSGFWHDLRPIAASIHNSHAGRQIVTEYSENRILTDDLQAAVNERQPTLGDERRTFGGMQASIFGLISAIGEMISPTVYAQDVSPESGETVTKALGTIPAGESVTVRFRATVDPGPYQSGVNTITNTAAISGNFTTVNTNNTSINLDAAPDLVVTKTESSGATTQPSGTVVYTLSYSNASDTTPPSSGQNAVNVVLTETVPPNTTFNATASLPSVWSCPDGSVGGTTCTISIGALNDGAGATATFAVNLAAALPVGLTQISNTSSIAENPVVNGTDRNAGNNSGPDTTNIIGNWDGSAGAGGFGDWNAAANWSNDVVPPSGNNVSIPNVANQPRVSTVDVTLNNMLLNGENVEIQTGRTITVNGLVTLGANTVEGAGTLALGASAPAISRSTGQVNATLSKTFSATGPFIYTVGTGAQYSPVNVVINSGAGSLSVRANTGTVPATVPPPAGTTLQRWWRLNGSGIIADVTFNYLQADVAGNENNYRIMRVRDGNKISLANGTPCPGVGSPCVNPTVNTIFIGGLSIFSDWTASELAPTAANVSVSGRVLTPEGNGAMRSVVSLIDPNGNTVYSTANHFGYFRFVNVPAGQTYVLAVVSKRYVYAARSISVTDDLEGLLITPDQ